MLDSQDGHPLSDDPVAPGPCLPAVPLTVVVVNHQGRGKLEATLPAVRALRPRPAEVILVDNASTDGSREYAAALFPEVRIVPLPRNLGPGHAREVGYRASGTVLVGFIDNDVVPAPDCFALLAGELARWRDAAIAMPRIVHAHAPERIQFEGAQAHFLGVMTLEAAEQPVTGAPTGTYGISSLVSSCFLVDRRRWGARVLQDASFFFCHGDHDLGLRARQLGHRLLSVPSAVCRHGSGTPGLSPRASGGLTAQRVRLTIANRWRIIVTRYELRTILLLAPGLLVFELFQLAGAAAKGWLGHWAWAVAAIAGDRRDLMRERRAWRRQRRVGDGRVLVGGPLPFNPCLLTGRLERWAGRLLAGVLAVNWGLARPLLNHRAAGARSGADAT